MTYTVSAIRRGFHGTALPLDLIPARSSLPVDLAIVAGFAVVALARRGRPLPPPSLNASWTSSRRPAYSCERT